MHAQLRIVAAVVSAALITLLCLSVVLGWPSASVSLESSRLAVVRRVGGPAARKAGYHTTQTNNAVEAAHVAATEHKEVMVATANLRAVTSMLPLLLLSMRLAPSRDLSRHLIVEVDSAPALQACRRIHIHCTIQSGREQSAAAASASADFATVEYFGLNWRSLELARHLLSEGFTVLNIDVDVGLLQNPFDVTPMHHNDTGDFVAARDNPGGQFCLGFIMFRPTSKAIALLSHMLELRNTPDTPGFELNEQILLNRILNENEQPPLPEGASGIAGVEIDSRAFTSFCYMHEEATALPNLPDFAAKFAKRLEQQEGGFQRYACLQYHNHLHRMSCSASARDHHLFDWPREQISRQV